MGLPVIGMMVSLIGSFAQAMMTSAAAKAEAQIKNQQLKVDMENERIRNMAEQNDRNNSFLRAAGANRVAAAIATGGTGGQNYSYDQGIAPYNKEVVARDLQRMGFNSDQQTKRMAYEIRVNKYQAKAAGRAAMVGAFVEGFSTVTSYASRPGGLLA